jgi:hypothetical protein
MSGYQNKVEKFKMMVSFRPEKEWTHSNPMRTGIQLNLYADCVLLCVTPIFLYLCINIYVGLIKQKANQIISDQQNCHSVHCMIRLIDTLHMCSLLSTLVEGANTYLHRTSNNRYMHVSGR